MVEEHRKRTDLSPATAVVLCVHSSSTHWVSVWAFPAVGVSLWRRVPLLPLCGSPPVHETSNTSKVRKSFLFWELLSVSFLLFFSVSKHLEQRQNKESERCYYSAALLWAVMDTQASQIVSEICSSLQRQSWTGGLNFQSQQLLQVH